ncbi:MAG: hypothetical protein RJA19_744 [Bacteroidota bacterium]
MAQVTRDVQQAAEWLRRGELVAIPTETVYGLACNGLNEKAVGQIFQAKSRPSTNPLILHVPHLGAVQGLVRDLPPLARVLMERFWPGPLTLLLDRAPGVPDAVTAGLPRVAVRMPDHPLTLALLAALDFPLAAPSANRSGYVSPTTAEHVKAQLGDRITGILDGGPCAQGLESTVVAVEGGADGRDEVVVYRLGAVPVEALRAFLDGLPGSPVLRLHTAVGTAPPSAAAPLAAPGLLSMHYSPLTRLLLVDAWDDPQLAAQLAALPPGARVGWLGFTDLPPAARPGAPSRLLSPTGDLGEAARHLYGALIALDGTGCDLLVAHRLPPHDLGAVMNERLTRAAARHA